MSIQQAKINVAQRSFDQAAQLKFARLSGDHNPIHLDPTFARRTQVGDVVVHGVNMLLWALDAAAASGKFDRSIGSLEVRFLKPLYLNEIAVASIATHPAKLELKVSVLGMTIMEVLLREALQELDDAAIAGTNGAASEWHPPLDRADEDLSECKGTIVLVSGADCAETLPSICNAIGAGRVAAILGITQIVGMECPGLHSLLAGIKATFEHTSDDSVMDYSVVTYDHRFRSVRMMMVGGGLRAKVQAFNRPRPVKQPRIREIETRVPRHIFSGQHALIIGGSKGLGEMTAKAVIAGGGSATITYSSSRTEAEQVATEIRDWGGDCAIAFYDVRKPAAEQISAIQKKITHVYYFATPRIFRRNVALYDPAVFDEFALFYVNGFASLYESLPASVRTVFYPSTVAVDCSVWGLSEYAAAKAAGERLCCDLQEFHPQLRLLVKRLPRVLTDQTATVAIVRAESAEDVMIPIVTEMHELAKRQVKERDT